MAGGGFDSHLCHRVHRCMLGYLPFRKAKCVRDREHDQKLKHNVLQFLDHAGRGGDEFEVPAAAPQGLERSRRRPWNT